MARQPRVKTWVVTTPERPWRRMKAPPQRTRGRANLSLDGTRDQVWEGFGGCFNELGWVALEALGAAQRDRIMNALFGPRESCRFNLCRLPIGASDYAAEWYSHNETPGDYAMRRFSIARDRDYLVPYIRMALKRQLGLALFASPWSPPTWMKSPRAYNYGTIIWKPQVLRAYALYLARFVEAYAREGIAIRQIHVQNEPLADQKFPSCLWTGEQMRDFIRDYLGPIFRRRRLGAEIWLGTLNTDDHDGYPLTVLSDAKARRLISGVGFQWAGKGAVQRAHVSWPGLRLMQTENECGDGRNTWQYAGYVFNLMQHYISNGVSAYVYWNMVLPEGGLSTWGWRQNSMVTVDMETRRVTFQPEFYVMKHFSRFIRPGAVRLGLTGHWAGNAVAFENPGGGIVLVVRNPLGERQELRFGRLSAVTLPPNSIHTLVIS